MNTQLGHRDGQGRWKIISTASVRGGGGLREGEREGGRERERERERARFIRKHP